MKFPRIVLLTIGLAAVFVLVGCAPAEPAQVEVTRVVEVQSEPEVVEVTRIVEGESQTIEVTRVVVEEVEVAVEPEPKYPEGTELSILQWSHFVPQYDTWFDPFAKAWGDDVGVDVTVDHINLAPNRLIDGVQ